MKKILGIIAALVIIANFAMAQVSFKIPLQVTANGVTKTAEFGVNTGNTPYSDYGVAFGAYEEGGAPPAPPAPFTLDLRYFAPAGWPNYTGGAMVNDFRGYTSSTQVDTFRLKISSDDGGGTPYGPWTISWPANLNLNGTAWTIKPATGSDFASTNMLSTTSVSFAPSNTSLFVLIIKTGALAPTPGPTFMPNTSTLAFGTVAVGGNNSQNLVVTNTGNANALSITGVTLPAGYSIAPSTFPIAVAPGANTMFAVTFTPTAGGAANGNIVFTHTAPGGSTTIAVTGDGLSQGGKLGFTTNRTYFDNSTGYKDTLKLTLAGNPMKALQFRIVTDSLLIIRSVSRGAAIPAAFWNFSSVIKRGKQNVDGSSKDTIKIVILGNDTTKLVAGTYNDFVRFEYDAVNISEPDTQSVKIAIKDVFSSQFDGTSAMLTADTAMTVTLFNRAQMGDVNEDDRLDVLDMLMIIDHILNKDTLKAQAFIRANLAPWGAPDAFVDVQDLALLQNIILTGKYPNGVLVKVGAPAVEIPVVKSLAKSSANGDVKITYFVTEKGIAIKLENKVSIKGVQVDFSNINEAAVIRSATSIFGNASFSLNNGSLRLLVYSESGALVEPGTHIIAQVPFTVAKPAEVAISELTVASSNNTRIKDVEVLQSLNEAPELPTTYSLGQNYPNPFNPSTTIQFTIPQDSKVSISVFNVLGQEVRSLFKGDVKQGTYAARWNGLDNNGVAVSSGTYIYRMTSGKFVETRKMLLMK